MNRTLRAFPFDGINTDSLGHYLAGLGLLAATARRWPGIRACWHRGRFMLLSDQIAEIAEFRQYLLIDWRPTTYERWWRTAQKMDTKTRSSTSLWKGRNDRTLSEVRLLDAHVVGMGRNCFNPVLGTGGNVGKRDFAKVWKDSVNLLKKPARSQWLDATLTGQADCEMPDLSSGGTWFVFANKTFNSGQSWYREGQLSPWSFLLSMEGALLLVGGVNRRLGSHSHPYAVFPFVSKPSQPETEGEIGLARAEFWAPLWKNPATLGEVKTLLQQGQARIGGRPAQAPSEFAVAALAAGVDAGVAEFARYELRQTTSSQVFEAIPRDHVEVESDTLGARQRSSRAIASSLLVALLQSGWLDRLPYEPRDSKQKGKFVGLRGPIETAIVRIGEHPDDATRWQSLLLKLANAQTRIDRNKTYRERCAAIRPLDPAWFDLAWPKSSGIPAEIEMARAIASIGWPCDAKTGDLPLLANVFGVEVATRGRNIGVHFPKARTAHAVWGSGTPLQLLLDIAHRRLVDADKPTSKPFAAACVCSVDGVYRLLRADGSIDLEEVIRWVPALSLINWSRRERLATAREQHTDSAVELDGTMLVQALARPLFHGRKLVVRSDAAGEPEPLFPQKLEPTAGLLRRVFNLLRFNSLNEAIQVLRDRYLAAGRGIVMPPAGLDADGELIAASLLVPISDQAVARGFCRWLQPSKRRFD
jgi:CRISPR-associated protein Csx17